MIRYLNSECAFSLGRYHSLCEGASGRVLCLPRRVVVQGVKEKLLHQTLHPSKDSSDFFLRTLQDCFALFVVSEGAEKLVMAGVRGMAKSVLLFCNKS